MNTKAKNYTLEVEEEMKVTVGTKQEVTVGEGGQIIKVGGVQEMTITGNQNIKTKKTIIDNNVDVTGTGTLTASVDVKAGSKPISLVDHKHRDSAGVKPGITTEPIL
jgi:flagellar basal body L-ring protein FlgH